MNKEEIDNLEDYLKNNLPRIKSTLPITTFGSVDLADLMDSIKQLKKVPTYDELLRENKRLRNQLEEKNKVIKKQGNVIGEAIKYMDMVADSEVLIEFEKWLKENITKMKQCGKVMKSNIFVTKDLEHALSIMVLESALDKLQELKEGKK